MKITHYLMTGAAVAGLSIASAVPAFSDDTSIGGNCQNVIIDGTGKCYADAVHEAEGISEKCPAGFQAMHRLFHPPQRIMQLAGGTGHFLANPARYVDFLRVQEFRPGFHFQALSS